MKNNENEPGIQMKNPINHHLRFHAQERTEGLFVAEGLSGVLIG